jgi:hypothetical protein
MRRKSAGVKFEVPFHVTKCLFVDLFDYTMRRPSYIQSAP